MHAHAQIAQRARRAVARGGLRYRAGHLGISQDAGACIFVYFYGGSGRFGSATAEQQLLLNTPGLVRPDPHARVSSTAFGLS